MTTLSLHLQSIYAMKAALNVFFYSPHTLNPPPQTHMHNTLLQYKNNKAVKMPLSQACTVSLHCFRWKALTGACDYDFWQGMINWMFKNHRVRCRTLTSLGIFDQDCRGSLVRWPAQGCQRCRWRCRGGVGVLMWWRGKLLSIVWNNELMELGLHDAGPLMRPTGGILA